MNLSLSEADGKAPSPETHGQTGRVCSKLSRLGTNARRCYEMGG